MAYFVPSRKRISKSILITTVGLLLAMLLSACNGDPQAQQRAALEKAQLDTSITYAHNVGVPSAMLQPIVRQERQVSSTSVPFSIVSDQPATDYYNNVAQRYMTLAVEVSGLETRVTQEFDHQAFLDILDLENILAKREAQGFIEAKTFADQLTQDQTLLANARYPKDYLQISDSARSSTQALLLMGTAYDNLQSLRQVTQQLQTSHVETAALVLAENNDLVLFRHANKPEDFVYLIDQMRTQIQEATDLSIQAIPYVGAFEGAIKLQQFGTVIDEGKKYNMDVTAFQRRLAIDHTNLSVARGNAYSQILAQIDADIAAMQIPLMRAKANFFLKQFQQEVQAWGKRHRYVDAFNNQTYNLDYEYDNQGIGSDAASAVQSAQTMDDFQAAITLINNDLVHLKAMEADYNDRAPWYQGHGADFNLLKYYHLYNPGVATSSAIVVSLVEQTLRFYQGAKLVKAFQVTTGQYERPSPPGLWNIFLREHPTEFTSSEPPGSAFWYPPTKIEYAMEYHDGGYFLHDSWWRVDYGVGTNFPHYDSGGDESFAGNGSHGCINMAPNDVSWLYSHTTYGTTVIVY